MSVTAERAGGGRVQPAPTACRRRRPRAGREALAQLVHDEYMGEVRVKVKRLMPLI